MTGAEFVEWISALGKKHGDSRVFVKDGVRWANIRVLTVVWPGGSERVRVTW